MPPQKIFITQDPPRQPGRPRWEPSPPIIMGPGPYTPGQGQQQPGIDNRRYYDFDRPDIRPVPGAIDPIYGQGPGHVGAGSGSAIDRYYQRALELMPTRRSQGFVDLAGILGGFSSGEKADRVVRGNFQQDHDRMMLDREGLRNQLMMNREAERNRLGLDAQSDYDRLKLLAGAERRDSESDALRKVQIADFISSGGIKPFSMTQTPELTLPGGQRIGGQSVASFSGMALPPIGEGEKQAANILRPQMLDRLSSPAFEPTKFEPKYDYEPDWGYQPSDPSQYSKPGLLENIGKWGAVGTGVLGALDMFRGGDESGAVGGVPGVGAAKSLGKGLLTGGKSVGNTVGGMFQGAGGSSLLNYAPYAAAVPLIMGTGGRKGSAASGAVLGAKIGSAFGPIGTGVGAGIGALGGWIRGGGPSKTERQGRDAASQARSSITAGATPQQLQEAGGDPRALTHIVLRDRFGNDALASQMVEQLWRAEKDGPDAVNRVVSSLG